MYIHRRKLKEKGKAQYAPGTVVRVLAVGADGTVGPRARKMIAELLRLREEKGVTVPGVRDTDLGAELAVGLAQKEEACYREWQGKVRASAVVKAAFDKGQAAVAAATAAGELLEAELGASAGAPAVAQK